MKVYISGALAAAANLQESILFYESIAALLESKGFFAHLPHKQNHPSVHRNRDDVSVYKTDIEALLCCDVCLARIDEPSLGVGAEIAIALQQRSLPVVAYHKEGAKVSRFVTGLIRDAGRPNAVLIYKDVAELRALLIDYLPSIFAVART